MLFTWRELAEITHGKWLQNPTLDDGISDISTDSRNIGEQSLFLALVGERFDGHDFAHTAAASGAAAALVSKPVDAKLPQLLVANTLRAYQQLATFHRERFSDLLIVGITGSSGKTSSKEIISSVLKAHFGDEHVLTTVGNTNNQIGVPHNLLRLTAEHRCAILEMGTNYHGEIAILRDMVQPQIAVLTNIGPVHLEGLGSVEGVAREKSSVFKDAALGIVTEVERQNAIVAAALPEKSITTGFSDGCDIRVEYLKGDLRKSRFRAWGFTDDAIEVSWNMRGKHMASNAAAALAIAKHLGIPVDTTIPALSSIEVPGMRMQVLEQGSRTWINDAYNANPDSMKAMIDWLAESRKPGRLTLVLGDMLELGPDALRLHEKTLSYALEQSRGAAILGFGPIMKQASDALGLPSCTSIDEARDYLASHTRDGDCIALKGSRGMALERLLQA